MIRRAARAGSALITVLAIALPAQVHAAGSESLSAAAQRRAAAAPRAALQNAPAPSSSERTGLRSRKGTVAVVLMGGAMAWLLVSRHKDIIHSPARD